MIFGFSVSHFFPLVVVRFVKRLFSLLGLVVLWKCDDVSEEPAAFIVITHLL